MKKMAILAVSMGFSVCAYAQTAPAEKTENFAQRKAEAIKAVEERMSELNQLKACISAATEPGSIKKCHETHKSAMKGMRNEIRVEKIQRIEQRQQKLEQKKQELKNKKEAAPSAN